MKINDNPNESNQPLCRFGPGGDFVSEWPAGAQILDNHAGGLTKVLNSISDIITGLLGSQPDETTLISNEIKGCDATTPCRKEESEYAIEHTDIENRTYTPTITIIKGNRRFPGKQMLFADDWRAGSGNENKPKHHIRTHRRTAKKRPSGSLPGQGSLFETDFKGAKTA